MEGGKRSALLAAARAEVLAGGASGLKLEAVLRSAGAGTGTFYHHFPAGKPQLVAELYEQARAEYEEAALRVLQRNRDAEAAVRALVHHHVRWFAAERDTARLLLGNRAAEQAAGTRGFLRALRTWAASAGLGAISADQLEALWLGPVLEWGRLWLAGCAGDADGAADRLARAAWSALSDA